MKKKISTLAFLLSITSGATVADEFKNTTTDHYKIDDTILCFNHKYEEKENFSIYTASFDNCNTKLDSQILYIEQSNSEILIKGWVMNKNNSPKSTSRYKGIFFIPEFESCVYKQTDLPIMHVKCNESLSDITKRYDDFLKSNT